MSDYSFGELEYLKKLAQKIPGFSRAKPDEYNAEFGVWNWNVSNILMNGAGTVSYSWNLINQPNVANYSDGATASAFTRTHYFGSFTCQLGLTTFDPAVNGFQIGSVAYSMGQGNAYGAATLGVNDVFFSKGTTNPLDPGAATGVYFFRDTEPGYCAGVSIIGLGATPWSVSLGLQFTGFRVVYKT